MRIVGRETTLVRRVVARRLAQEGPPPGEELRQAVLAEEHGDLRRRLPEALRDVERR